MSSYIIYRLNITRIHHSILHLPTPRAWTHPQPRYRRRVHRIRTYAGRILDISVGFRIRRTHCRACYGCSELEGRVGVWNRSAGVEAVALVVLLVLCATDVEEIGSAGHAADVGVGRSWGTWDALHRISMI